MFRTLTISLVLLLVTGAGNIEGKANQAQEGSQQPLHVRIYDYARVSPEVLAEAESAAGSIFRRIDVEIPWSDHSSSGSSVEQRIADLGPGDPTLQLRILDRRMSESLSVTKTMTGLAFQGTAGQPGKVTNVFYSRMEDLAGSKLCSKGEVLGHAAAHELGHLLLGNLDHSFHRPHASQAGTQGPSRCGQRRSSVYKRGSCADSPSQSQTSKFDG